MSSAASLRGLSAVLYGALILICTLSVCSVHGVKPFSTTRNETEPTVPQGDTEGGATTSAGQVNNQQHYDEQKVTENSTGDDALRTTAGSKRDDTPTDLNENVQTTSARVPGSVDEKEIDVTDERSETSTVKENAETGGRTDEETHMGKTTASSKHGALTEKDSDLTDENMDPTTVGAHGSVDDKESDIINERSESSTTKEISGMDDRKGETTTIKDDHFVENEPKTTISSNKGGDSNNPPHHQRDGTTTHQSDKEQRATTDGTPREEFNTTAAPSRENWQDNHDVGNASETTTEQAMDGKGPQRSPRPPKGDTTKATTKLDPSTTVQPNNKNDTGRDKVTTPGLKVNQTVTAYSKTNSTDEEEDVTDGEDKEGTTDDTDEGGHGEKQTTDKDLTDEGGQDGPDEVHTEVDKDDGHGDGTGTPDNVNTEGVDQEEVTEENAGGSKTDGGIVDGTDEPDVVITKEGGHDGDSNTEGGTTRDGTDKPVTVSVNPSGGGDGDGTTEGGTRDGTEKMVNVNPSEGGDGDGTTEGGTRDGTEKTVTVNPSGGGDGDGTTEGDAGGSKTQGGDGGGTDVKTDKPDDVTTNGGGGDGGEGDGGRNEEFNLNVAIFGPMKIPSCGDVKLEGRVSGTNLPDMRYKWSISPMDNDQLTQMLARINEIGTTDILEFSGGLLKPVTDYIVTLTVQTDKGNQDATIMIRQMISVSPGLTTEARGLSGKDTVLASETFYLEAVVTFYSCIQRKTTKYSWSALDSNGMSFYIDFKENSPKQKIVANMLPVNNEVTFTIQAWREGDDESKKASAEFKITVKRSPLVAIIAGGSQRTFGKASEGMLSLNASGSKDPDAITSTNDLVYQWSCSRPEQAACNLGVASLNRGQLHVAPGGLAVGKHTFTVTVSKPNADNANDHRQATASVEVDVQDGSPPEAVLTRDFNGKFKPRQVIVVTAEISRKGDTTGVEWEITKGGEIQNVNGLETSFEMNKADDTATASMTLLAGSLTPGSDYMIKVMMFDRYYMELSAASTMVTIYPEITGCQVSLLDAYIPLKKNQIKMSGCVGSDGMTYQAFVAPSGNPTKKKPLMTVAVESSLLNIDYLWPVDGAEYVTIIVRVCGKVGGCKEFKEESVRQIVQDSEEAILLVQEDIQKDKDSGQFVDVFHKNSMILRLASTPGGTRRRRGVEESFTIITHAGYLADATSLLGSIDSSQRSSIISDLDVFPDVQSDDQSRRMMERLDELIDSYQNENADNLLNDFEAINQELADTHAGLVRPEDRRRVRRLSRKIFLGIGPTLQNRQEEVSYTSLVHSKLRKGGLQHNITFENVNVTFPSSLIYDRLEGSEVLLLIENYTSKDEDQFAHFTVSIADIYGSDIAVMDLPERINLTFPAVPKLQKKICKYFDESTEKWSDSGIKTTLMENGAVTCQTNHLTEFAVEVFVDPFEDDAEEVALKGLTVGAVIGIIIGVLALMVIVIIIVFMVMKMSKNKKVNPHE